MLSKLSGSNKKLVIVVSALALVTGLVTLYAREGSQLRRMGFPSIGSITTTRPAESLMIQNDADMMVKEQMMAQPGVAMDSTMIAPDIYPYPYPDDNALDVADRLYQRSSYHGVVVNDVPSYLRTMREYVLSIGGRVLSSEQGENRIAKHGYLDTRVPVDKFEEATMRVTEGVDEVANESINSQDVTGQAVSLEEQMQQLQDQRLLLEAQLVDATTELERRRIELQIQRLDNQISNLEDRQEGLVEDVEYATVVITAADDNRFFNPDADPSLRQELEDAWDSAREVLMLGVRLIIWVAVYAIIWLPLILVLRWLMGKLSRSS